ncbi:MAG: VOC family protein [Candidatus Latescibacterota bacterium]
MAREPRFEHFAINVADPVAVAEWYCHHLGMKVVRRGEAPMHMRFLADATGRVVVEIYHSASDPVPDYAAQPPLVLHFAFDTDDLDAQRQRLLGAGATPAGEVSTTPAGDRLAMLRDPWGLALQLCQRVTPMA